MLLIEEKNGYPQNVGYKISRSECGMVTISQRLPCLSRPSDLTFRSPSLYWLGVNMCVGPDPGVAINSDMGVE